MLFALLVDHERLVQSMLGSDLEDLGGVVVLQLVDVSDNLALICTDGSEEQGVLEIAVVAEGEGSMMIFSSNSMSSRGRLALRKTWTVAETSFGSVNSGKTVATICRDRSVNSQPTHRRNQASPGRSKRDDKLSLVIAISSSSQKPFAYATR